MKSDNRRWTLGLLLCGTAAAQSLTDAEHAAAVFDSAGAETALRCDVKPVAPALNFGLRFQAGYLVTFPLRQFTGSGHRLHVLLRVTPEGGPVAFLTDTVDLPDVPKTRMNAIIFGSVLVGEGNYRAAARVEDEQHRVCRAEWSMHARRDRAEQSLTPAMPPGTVAALSSAAAVQASTQNADAGRLTVLLHAAPLRMRSSVLQPSDIQRLTGSLAAVLERVPASSVRLVVFNVDQQKELLRRDQFAAGDIDSVTKALNELQVGTVDYKVLRDPRGGAAMLAGILSAELREAKDGDAVVLLGPEARTLARLPADAIERPGDNTARVFYLQFLPRPFGSAPQDPPLAGGRGTGGRGAGAGGGGGGGAGRGGPGRGGAGGSPGRGGVGAPLPPDTIQRIVKRLKGAVLAVRTPQDFARAVARVNRR
jgi:uncharacterized membrane protein YgcG